ncbi:MAG: hypothetical protein JXR94_24785 [Candidatus Hydrogenedentes bacterium]|nr:hypothetical protein [Candidatus Hydrogenedentota bacterium]
MRVPAASLVFLTILLLTAHAGAQQGPQPPGAVRAIRVDASNVIGRIRSFQGVNVGPAHTRREVPGVARQYRELHIDSVRTHDFYGPCDIDAWRPGEPWNALIFPDAAADPEQEGAYNFGPSDRLIQAIMDSGAEAYFRLGRSWGADASPPDPDRFASVCRHIVMHYNAGWADGHHFNIRYWEVWNEPNGQMFWTGTPVQFFRLYERVARELKRHDPALKVGACGLAGGSQPSPYREDLIRYCAQQGAPLDFYSWHHYHGSSGDPYDMVRIGQQVRALLDKSGFTEAESHITEWNLALGRQGTQHQESMQAGAFTACALMYLQDAPVDLAHYYRGDAAHGMGLFFQNGAYKKKAYAFRATGLMLDTPERLAVDGADTQGLAVLAGRSPGREAVQILIANYEIRPVASRRPMHAALTPRENIRYRDNRGYALSVENLPWGAQDEFVVSRYRVAESADFARVGQTPGTGTRFEARYPLPPPTVELIVIERR